MIDDYDDDGFEGTDTTPVSLSLSLSLWNTMKYKSDYWNDMMETLE